MHKLIYMEIEFINLGLVSDHHKLQFSFMRHDENVRAQKRYMGVDVWNNRLVTDNFDLQVLGFADFQGYIAWIESLCLCRDAEKAD